MPYHAPSHATLTRTSAIPYGAAYALACVILAALTLAGLAFLAFIKLNAPLQPSATPYSGHACHVATCMRPTLRAALAAS